MFGAGRVWGDISFDPSLDIPPTSYEGQSLATGIWEHDLTCTVTAARFTHGKTRHGSLACDARDFINIAPDRRRMMSLVLDYWSGEMDTTEHNSLLRYERLNSTVRGSAEMNRYIAALRLNPSQNIGAYLTVMIWEIGHSIISLYAPRFPLTPQFSRM